MTTEEVIQMRIRSIQREIDDLERTKAVMVNETARKGNRFAHREFKKGNS